MHPDLKDNPEYQAKNRTTNGNRYPYDTAGRERARAGTIRRVWKTLEWLAMPDTVLPWGSSKDLLLGLAAVIDPEFVGVEDTLLRIVVGIDGTLPLLRGDEVMGGEDEDL